jgi:hypothetical protein
MLKLSVHEENGMNIYFKFKSYHIIKEIFSTNYFRKCRMLKRLFFLRICLLNLIKYYGDVL